MSIILNINGTSYQFPEEGDENWGQDVTDWAQAVTVGMLQKAGGEFLLQSEVDFGGSFGLKSVYYKSQSENVASAGQIRLANADSIAFRNKENSADLNLGVDDEDDLVFKGKKISNTVINESSNCNYAWTGSITEQEVVDLAIAFEKKSTGPLFVGLIPFNQGFPNFSKIQAYAAGAQRAWSVLKLKIENSLSEVTTIFQQEIRSDASYEDVVAAGVSIPVSSVNTIINGLSLGNYTLRFYIENQDIETTIFLQGCKLIAYEL